MAIAHTTGATPKTPQPTPVMPVKVATPGTKPRPPLITDFASI